ncbi:MAG: hypothetical protein ABR555_02510 [Pyrinomonadaceae bacterium]
MGPHYHRAARTPLLLLWLTLLTSTTSAQGARQPPPPPPLPDSISGRQNDELPLTTVEEEMRAKRAIKLLEKEHQENITRAKEVSARCQQLLDGLNSRAALDREDSKLLDRIEKLTKKIRGEAGGGDDDGELEKRPGDLSGTVSNMCDVAQSLSKEVQNTPRQVISASIIDKANVLLELVEISRMFVQ